jgi:Predicted RNA methylase
MINEALTLAQLFTQLVVANQDDKINIDLLTQIEKIIQSFATLNVEELESGLDIGLSQGVAINPQLAAQCFTDYLRTHRFMLGTYECVKQLVEKQIKPVRILYAGTGPYATIVLPLLYLFNRDQISISAIEINSDSYQAATHLIHQLGKDAYFESFLLADAITYTTDGMFDIIISETMDKALTREPQLAIFNNLINFLVPSGYLIPEAIKVDLFASSIYLEKDVPYYCFDDTETRMLNSQHRQFIDTIIRADRYFFETNKLHLTQSSVFLKTVKTNHVKERLGELIFITEVVVFGNILLLEDDSTLNKKYICYSFTEVDRGKDFDLYYLNNESPRIALYPKN